MFTSPYHPQTNELIECLNKTLKKEIATYINTCHKTWDQILSFVTHAYNTSVKASTQINPFRALYGRDPRLPPESSIDIHSKPANMDRATWGLYLQQMFPLLRQTSSRNLQVAQQRQKHRGIRLIHHSLCHQIHQVLALT